MKLGDYMKVLFLGDSITQAIPGVSYVSMVQDSLSEYNLVNRGIGGDTVSSLFRRVKKMNDLSSYDQIVIFIGVNDVFGKLTNVYKVLKTLARQRWAKNDDVFMNHYNELITYIMNENKKIIIIPPLLIGEDISNKWNTELNTLIKIIKDISNENNLSYLDLYNEYKEYLKDKHISDYLPMKIIELLKDVKGLSSASLTDQKSKERGLHLTLDGVHINSEGAKIISNAIIDEILKTT